MAIRPPILQRGDTIGIVTLGSPLDATIIDERIKTIENMGFNVVVGKYAYAYGGIVASTAQQRAEDLMSMFENRSVKMILPTRGGTGVKDILPFLNYTIIKNNPKIVTGYSDITILLNVLYQFSDLITFQSLLLIDFSASTPTYNFNQFYSATSTLSSPRVIQNPPGMLQTSLIAGNVRGPIVGGNLTSFVDTLGTPYEINTVGKILVIEETHEATNVIYRYLTRLIMARKIQDCIGVVMGQCTNCTISYSTTYNDLITDVIAPLGKPLMTNVSTAHGLYKAAIPIGANVNLDTYNNRLTVLEPTVKA
ncbi:MULTISPECIES: S66 peptidase family protein [unclassified Paenibacillus]|uniref:S66 peptidase family protein n=1 Tax=unclassified Paenibacillus TaxID=185978 RepID=UPI00070D0EB3|nr:MULTISPECIES: LD-carboxypeptidase [unclassified Paenibacillus]KQX69085.1 LD-carboxypeptidase [Paenibacillus sp. Root444D2]KRE51631.1 LD-carboxypeptidase [Paenibacillus sp. Soil724D2]